MTVVWIRKKAATDLSAREPVRTGIGDDTACKNITHIAEEINVIGVVNN